MVEIEDADDSETPQTGSTGEANSEEKPEPARLSEVLADDERAYNFEPPGRVESAGRPSEILADDERAYDFEIEDAAAWSQESLADMIMQTTEPLENMKTMYVVDAADNRRSCNVAPWRTSVADLVFPLRFSILCQTPPPGLAFVMADMVEAHSLKAEHLNGLRGKIVEFRGERIGVDFGPPQGRKALLPQNLRRLKEKRAADEVKPDEVKLPAGEEVDHVSETAKSTTPSERSTVCCCVCLQGTARRTRCEHLLCEPCEASLKSRVCPMCRSELDEDAEREKEDASDESSSDDGLPMMHTRAMRPVWRGSDLEPRDPVHVPASEEPENPAANRPASMRERAEAFLASARSGLLR